MTDQSLIATIDAAWEDRAAIGLTTGGDVRMAVNKALAMLDSGEARVAEPTANGWQVNQWLKKAVLLSFRLNDNYLMPGGPGAGFWWDKVAEQVHRLGRGGVSRRRASAPCRQHRARRQLHREDVILMPAS